jgi:hypothetical protein
VNTGYHTQGVPGNRGHRGRPARRSWKPRPAGVNTGYDTQGVPGNRGHRGRPARHGRKPRPAGGGSAFLAGAGRRPRQRGAGSFREFGLLNNAIEKVVVWDTLTMADTGPGRDRTPIVRRSGAHAEIAAVKRTGEGGIVVFGRRTLHVDLLAAGLVDEVHLLVGALALGAGTRSSAARSAAARRSPRPRNAGCDCSTCAASTARTTCCCATPSVDGP